MAVNLVISLPGISYIHWIYGSGQPYSRVFCDVLGCKNSLQAWTADDDMHTHAHTHTHTNVHTQEYPTSGMDCWWCHTRPHMYTHTNTNTNTHMQTILWRPCSHMDLRQGMILFRHHLKFKGLYGSASEHMHSKLTLNPDPNTHTHTHTHMHTHTQECPTSSVLLSKDTHTYTHVHTHTHTRTRTHTGVPHLRRAVIGSH